MLKSNYKNSIITNSSIELKGDLSLEGNGKGHKFISRFIEPGIAEYKGTFGKILITKETLDSFIMSMVGCPVIIKHKDITDKNVDQERVGVVSEVWYNEADGWYYCSGILFDKQAIDLVKNQGWSVSCTYDFETDNTKGTYHGLDYDMQFTGGEFLHLALVPNPRYERANITVMNSKDEEQTTEKNSEVENSLTSIFAEAIAEVVTNCLGESRAKNWTKDNFEENKVKRDGGKFAKQENKSLSVEEKIKNIKPVGINKKDIPIFSKSGELTKWAADEFEKLGSVTIEDTGVEVQLSRSKANRESSKRRSQKEENKAVFLQFEEIAKKSIKKNDRQKDERHTKDQEIYYNKFYIIDEKGNKEHYEVNIFVDKPAGGDKNSYYAGHAATKIEIAPRDS